MNTPILFLNFKTYEQATGSKAVELAKKAESAAKETGKNVILVVQAVDIRLIKENCSLPVFAQHLDAVKYGSNTGWILGEAIKEAGASGTILNHAEHKISNEEIQKSITKAKELGLTVMVCAEDVERAKQIAEMKPDLIAIEPPELIGGDISVSTAQPELIENTVKEVHSIQNIPIITGAGIKNSADVKIAVKLGTVGIFVASGVIKAENQEEAVKDLLTGFD